MELSWQDCPGGEAEVGNPINLDTERDDAPRQPQTAAASIPPDLPAHP